MSESDDFTEQIRQHVAQALTPVLKARINYNAIAKVIMSSQFDSIVGKIFPFYGVYGHQFKLGSIIWEAVEEGYMSSVPSNGPVSMLGMIRVAGPIGMDILQKNRKLMEQIYSINGPTNSIFFRDPVATVLVQQVAYRGGLTGYRLVEGPPGQEHVWVEFGDDAAANPGVKQFTNFVFLSDPALTMINQPKVIIPTTTADGYRSGT